MRKKILTALLFVVAVITACSGTKTCTATGLTVGQSYLYGYEDGAGNTVVGEFTATSSTFQLSGVDSSVNCGSIDLLPQISPESPPIA